MEKCDFYSIVKAAHMKSWYSRVTMGVLQNLLATSFLLLSAVALLDAQPASQAKPKELAKWCRKGKKVDMLDLGLWGHLCTAASFGAVKVDKQPASWSPDRIRCTQCLKITEKVAFNIASELSYIYILSGQNLIEIAKFGSIWRVFENWSGRSNSVTRQINIIRTKIGGKCQN